MDPARKLENSENSGVGVPLRFISLGPETIFIPEHTELLRLSHEADKGEVEKFILNSPDQTVYNQSSYLDHVLEQGQWGETVALKQNGEIFFAIPLSCHGPNCLGNGYTSVLFPPAQLKRSLDLFSHFLEVNKHITFRLTQCVQSEGYNDPFRTALIDEMFCETPGSVSHLFSRILKLPSTDPSSKKLVLGKNLFEDLSFLENPLLSLFRGNCRNQIRQAIKLSPKLTAFVNSGTDKSVWERFHQVNRESVTRTNHSVVAVGELMNLSQAITNGKGTDLVIFATNSLTGQDLACVNIHCFRSRALYWRGYSVEAGLKQRANQLCLHTGITLSQMLQSRIFEIGRFNPRETNPKERQINQYKAQFGGDLVRVLNLTTLGQPVAPPNLLYRAAKKAARLSKGYVTRAIRRR